MRKTIEDCKWCGDDEDSFCIVSRVKAFVACGKCGSGRGYIDEKSLNSLVYRLQKKIKELKDGE